MSEHETQRPSLSTEVERARCKLSAQRSNSIADPGFGPWSSACLLCLCFPVCDRLPARISSSRVPRPSHLYGGRRLEVPREPWPGKSRSALKVLVRPARTVILTLVLGGQLATTNLPTLPEICCPRVRAASVRSDFLGKEHSRLPPRLGMYCKACATELGLPLDVPEHTALLPPGPSSEAPGVTSL